MATSSRKRGALKTGSASKPRKETAKLKSPKTTRPPAVERAPAADAHEGPVTVRAGRKFDAHPDRVDIRDWIYRPSLKSLPDQLINCEGVPEILDQGTEGACTGFALAAVIQFLLKQRNKDVQISPRMLYEMARRYDEWPGERYEGSSARGAMIGWASHGVCRRGFWPDKMKGARHFDQEKAEDAREVPGGAFYRVTHHAIRDVHAALAEAGILYVTLMVHNGWDKLDSWTPENKSVESREHSYVENGNLQKRVFPVIPSRKNAPDGHAVAIVGYTREGFIIQNSWGDGWGSGGYALLPYDDFMANATDVWVAQLGVPVSVDLRAPTSSTSALTLVQGGGRAVTLDEIRAYTIDVGSRGRLSDSGNYWTTPQDVDRLFFNFIPQRCADWDRRRVMLYLHGGLNSEDDAAQRIDAFRDVFLENEIYPLHIMWETGVMETVRNIISRAVSPDDTRASGWLDSFRNKISEAKDRTLELTLAKPGGMLWREMKTNAESASADPPNHRRLSEWPVMPLVADSVVRAIAAVGKKLDKPYELHLVAHSAGSIFAAHALRHLAVKGVNLSSVTFFAPAMTTELFRNTILRQVKAGRCPMPTMFILSDEGERDDTVKAYGKSLLYLVSNAFEDRAREPILGMDYFLQQDAELRSFFEKGKVNKHPSVVLAGQDKGPASRSTSDSHGGFDNDPATLNSLLRRILNKPDNEPLKRPFTDHDLKY